MAQWAPGCTPWATERTISEAVARSWPHVERFDAIRLSAHRRKRRLRNVKEAHRGPWRGFLLAGLLGLAGGYGAPTARRPPAKPAPRAPVGLASEDTAASGDSDEEEEPRTDAGESKDDSGASSDSSDDEGDESNSETPVKEDATKSEDKDDEKSESASDDSKAEGDEKSEKPDKEEASEPETEGESEESSGDSDEPKKEAEKSEAVKEEETPVKEAEKEEEKTDEKRKEEQEEDGESEDEKPKKDAAKEEKKPEASEKKEGDQEDAGKEAAEKKEKDSEDTKKSEPEKEEKKAEETTDKSESEKEEEKTAEAEESEKKEAKPTDNEKHEESEKQEEEKPKEEETPRESVKEEQKVEEEKKLESEKVKQNAEEEEKSESEKVEKSKEDPKEEEKEKPEESEPPKEEQKTSKEASVEESTKAETDNGEKDKKEEAPKDNDSEETKEAKIEESEAIVSEEQKEKKDSKKPEGAEEPKNEAESKDDQKDEKPEDGKGKEEANKTEEAPKKIEDSRKQGKLSGTEEAVNMMGEMLVALKSEETSEDEDKDAVPKERKQQAVDMMEEVLVAFKPDEKRKEKDEEEGVTKEMKQQAKEYFDWNRAWYPIAPLDYLHTDKPNPVKLLGKRMVVWCSDVAENIWHAALDSCPHRMAPLSIGEVLDSGELRCRYHGWSFNGAGSCVCVPQARNEAEEARISGLARSCLTTFPVQVKQGLVWIFPFAGQDATTHAKKSAPCVTPEMDGAEWIMTVAPVGYQVSVENTFDPSHAPFLHNGIVKYAAERARAITKFVLRDDVISGKRGFVLQHNGYDESTEGIAATRQFVPPCSNTTVYKYADGRVETNQLYFVPCGPHETRYIVNLGAGERRRRLPTIMEDVLHVLFFNKIFGYRFQEQDLMAMCGQERALQESANYAWGEQYVLGTLADKGVEVFRRWFYEFANGGPYFPRSSRTLPATDSMVFDRWQRHSKHCPRCRRVMRAFGTVQGAAGRVSVCGLIASAVFFFLHRRKATEATLLVTLLSAALGRWAAAERWGFVSSMPLKGLMEVAVYKDAAKDERVRSK